MTGNNENDQRLDQQPARHRRDKGVQRRRVLIGGGTVALAGGLVVDQDNDCAPLADALVELWHRDALGEYSGYVGNNGHSEPATARSCAAVSSPAPTATRRP
jgi:protocatechuate 3,4-dioxygenase beta subunit